MKDPEPLIPKYGAYRKLKSYRTAQLIHDVTALFCERYIDEQSYAHERMMQAAESGAQKIAEGSQAGEKSKKTELKLTTLARASLEELGKLYENYLRQQELSVWDLEDPRRAELVVRRPRTMDDVAQWAEWARQDAPSIQSAESTPSISGTSDSNAETMANGALALIALAFSVLDRQLSAQKRVVDRETNVAERLRRRRLADWPE